MSNQAYPYNPTGGQNYAPPPQGQQQQQQPYYPPQQQPYNPQQPQQQPYYPQQQQQQPYYPSQQQPYNSQQPPPYQQPVPQQQQQPQPYYPQAAAGAEKPAQQQPATPYVIEWMVTALWVRTMTVQGSEKPIFEVKHDGGFIGLGDKVSIFSLSPDGKEPTLFARLDWHSFKGKVDVLFKTRELVVTQRRIAGDFDTGVPALGKLNWVQKRMVPYGAALWELNDASGNKLVTSEVNDAQSAGSIKIWRTDFSKPDFEVLLMLGLAQIEDYKKLIRDGKRSAASVAIG